MPVIEDHCPRPGRRSRRGQEISPAPWASFLRERCARAFGLSAPENAEYGRASSRPTPGDVPRMSPQRAVLHVLKKLKLTVTGDIGCYTLGVHVPPHRH